MKIKTFCDAAGRTCALLSLLAMLSMLGPIPTHSADGGLRLAGLGGEEFAALATEAGAGEVGVLYGAAGGLSAASSQAWHQDSPGMEDMAEANDRLGGALAAGDFNGDGYGDLAVGVVNEKVGGRSGAGAVNVLYGSAAGLVAAGNQFWHQDSPGIAGEAEPEAGFGFALAAGDFNGDGYTDLAVGVPGQEIAGMAYAGAVNVLYGSPAGLVAAGNQYWHQDSPDIEGEAGLYDTFGYALAAGDFNRDGYADLAVGVPGESLGGLSGAGAVNVLYGSAGGLSAAANQVWHQDSLDMGAAERGDLFGSSLAAGDFDMDGYADLAVGVPSEDVGSMVDAGAVNVIYGSADGLVASGNQYWHQDNVGAGEVAAANDRFGRALCTGDLDGDGYADLVVGVPGKEMQSVKRAGAVNVLYGSAGGLVAVGSQIWHQDSPDVVGTADEGDSFGAALAAGDLNGDGYADLAVGVPLKGGEGAQPVSTPAAAGAVNVLYGSASGLSAAGNQAWRQGRAGLAGTAEANDFFGSALAMGDLDGDGYADLAIGVPGQVRYRAHLPVIIR